MPPKEDLVSMSKEELIARVEQLTSHATQLSNIIKKSQKPQISNKEKNQKKFDFSKHNTRHIALKVAYVGWDYHGFTVQEESEKTIEAALFEALLKTKLIESRETSDYHRCGRTDKGVSSFGQVISIDVRSNLSEGLGVKIRQNDGQTHKRKGANDMPEIRYAHILNRALPPEVRVLAWAPVDAEFSARFNCLSRTYKYFFPVGRLNIEKMSEAASHLIGEHDYRNFCKMDIANGITHFIRRIHAVNLKKGNIRADEYDMCELTIVGRSFLWHQIRCIVSLLLLIGQGKENPQLVEDLLDVKKNPRKPQYTMASELPLNLYDCQFDNLQWTSDEECHRFIIQDVQEMWAKHAVKAAMLLSMLGDLEATIPLEKDPTTKKGHKLLRKRPRSDEHDLTNWIIPGSRPHSHINLFARPMCESFEKRMTQNAKRRRVQPAGDVDSESSNSNESSTPSTVCQPVGGGDNDCSKPSTVCECSEMVSPITGHDHADHVHGISGETCDLITTYPNSDERTIDEATLTSGQLEKNSIPSHEQSVNNDCDLDAASKTYDATILCDQEPSHIPSTNTL